MSTNDAYLEPARGRGNLSIWGDCLVERVLWDGRRAAGVRLRRGGEWSEVRAGEVFLCAGVVHSPVILLRSGVGPADELRRLGIQLRLDLPGVGRNLSDHPMWTLVLPLRPEARARSEAAHVSCCTLAETSGLEAAGPNDLLYLALNLWGIGAAARPRGRLPAALVRCFSRGAVALAAADPEAAPRIEMRLLSDRRDLTRLRHGARRAMELVRSAPFAAILEAEPRVAGSELPVEAMAGEAELDRSLLRDVYTFNHGVGTCRMGAADDPDAVVDADCRVRGAEGLRVVDASVMPEVPRTYTHLTTVMIAEHLAGRIG